MDTVNLILNILRVDQFDFCQYGAKRTSVRSQPILTHATQNFFPKNRRDLDFHEHLLSRNFNYDLCKCRIVLPPRLLVKCKWQGKGDLSSGKKGLSRGGGGVLDQYLCIGESLTLNPEIHTLSRTLIVHGFCSGFSSLNLHYCLIQFLKQGPAYKKEEPDPDKGSNQQWVKISNKGSQSWFYSRKYIYMILSIFYLPFLVKNIYIPDCKISLASFV